MFFFDKLTPRHVKHLHQPIFVTLSFSSFQLQETEIEELFRTQDDLQAKYNDELREKKV